MVEKNLSDGVTIKLYRATVKRLSKAKIIPRETADACINRLLDEHEGEKGGKA